MASSGRVSVLSGNVIKAITAIYIAVSSVALAYALFSPQHQLLWTEILAAAVALFVFLGAWFSYSLSKDSLAIAMPLNIFAFISLAVTLALVAPQERILGGYIRLIYIHAAVTWVALALFAASFISGATHLPAAEKAPARWADAFFGNALYFWGASSFIGSIAAYLTWGEAWYLEPRTRMAFIILALALVVFTAGPMIKREVLRVALQTAVSAVIFLMLALTGKLVHPNNAFLKSDSLEIKIFALVIMLVFAGVAVQGVRWLALTRGARFEQ